MCTTIPMCPGWNWLTSCRASSDALPLRLIMPGACGKRCHGLASPANTAAILCATRLVAGFAAGSESVAGSENMALYGERPRHE